MTWNKPSLSVEPSEKRQTGRRVLFNTVALASASLWRVAISFVLQVLIARQLGVEGLGQYTIALAYLNVSQVVVELGLPTLLVRELAQQPTQRLSYFRWLLAIQLLNSLVVWAVLTGAGTWLSVGPATATSLWLVGASLPFYAITAAAQTLFQASERMELVMGVEIAINTLILAASIGVLWAGGDELALIAVMIGTQGASALACSWLLVRSQLLAGSQEPARTNPILLLRQTLPFLGLALAEVLLQRLDILLLSVVAGPAVTGLYSAAYNVVRVAMKLIQSFWRALYPTLSRLQHRSTEQYERLQALSLRFGLLALLLAAAVGFGAAAELLGWMLGDEYAAAGAVLRCLVWAIPLFLFEAYALTTLMIERQLRASLWISVLHIGALLGLLPPLAVLGGAVGAGIAVSLAGAAGTTAGLLLLRRPVAGIGQPGLWLAAGVAGTLAALAPFDWRLNALLAVCAYGILCWGTGVLTPNDLQALRRLLSNREHR